MVSRAHGNAHLVEYHSYIVMVATLDIERHDRSLTLGCAINSQSLNLQQLLGSIRQHLSLVACNLLGRQALQKLYSLRQADSSDIVRCSRLEFQWQRCVGSLCERHLIDHIATSHIWRHLVEQFSLAIQHAYSRRTIEFVSRKCVEVAIESLNIHPTMNNTLTAINHNHCTHRVRLCDNRCKVRASAERIRGLRNRHYLGAFVNQSIERIEFQCATIIHRDYSQLRTLALGSQLPWNNIRVVFDVADHDIVARTQELLAVARRHQVQGHRSSRSKDDLLTALRTDKPAYHLTRTLILCRHLLRQQMYATMDIGIIVQKQLRHLLHHAQRLLRRSCAIEVDERSAIHLTREYRELLAYLLYIKHLQTIGLIYLKASRQAGRAEPQSRTLQPHRLQNPPTSASRHSPSRFRADAYSISPHRRVAPR